jgi:hypothetical protein
LAWGLRQACLDCDVRYYRLTADNRILWGGYDVIYHFGNRIRAEQDQRLATQAALAEQFFSTFPQLEGLRFTRFGARVMLDLLDGADNERTRLTMVRTKPLPFPPEPFRYAGIQLTRWSIDHADRNGGNRNLWLRTLDKMGLGFES